MADAREATCGRREAGGDGSGRKPFSFPGAPVRFGRDVSAALRHIRLEIRLDFERRRVEGTVTHTLAALAGGLRTVALDAVGLEIERVTADGAPVPFWYDGERLGVTVDPPRPAGAEVKLSVRYSGSPRRGLYFLAPDEANPERPLQAWTQGEDEDNRYWLPCPDYPNQRATSEMVVTVPERMTAVSNGRLNRVMEAGRGERTFHWSMEIPHVTYLLSIAAGTFAEVKDEADGVPLSYYVAPGREAEARRSFGKTPDMIRAFNRRLGVKYPYPKYAQVAVADFLFGGMENISATTLTDLTLHDERAHLDFSSEPLVAHELAHQWFGDLVTCRTWPHAWLNESWATFLESVWREESEGLDEALYDRFLQGEEYFREDATRYRRPIVARAWRDPIEIFDRHLYEKGGRVLNMLRGLLGAGPFWEGVRLYLTRHAGGLAETEDFRRALEEVSGRDLGPVFDQWLYHGGHPDLRVEAAYDPDAAEVRVTVTQTQKPDDVTPVFTLPLPLEVVTAEGERRATLSIEGPTSIATIRVPGPPTMLRVDPGDTVLKSLDLRLPHGWLRESLAKDPDPIGRIRAAQALARASVPGGIAAVAAALRGDPFWGVRAECARALAKARGGEALAALVQAAASEKHPKARRAVADALGEFRAPEAAAALRPLATTDPSYYVCGSAAEALGRTRQPGALPVLVQARALASHRAALRSGALRGRGALRDAEALPLLRAWAAPGKPEPARVGAIEGIGRFASEAEGRLRREARELLQDLASDPAFRVREGAVRALASLRDPEAAGALRRARAGDLDGRVRRRAAEALRGLEDGGSGAARGLRDDLEAARDEARALAARVARLETLLGLGGAGASGASGANGSSGGRKDGA